MTHKAAYLWGPISSFSGPLTARLLQKGWHVHIATKSALNLFTLAPLDLRSSARSLLERALGGHDQLRTFQDRLRFLDVGEVVKGTVYDAVIFCGLPPNFDESRAPRAPWAAGELVSIAKMLKEVPTFIVSSLWAGVQPDGVVPEEFEFERRKPKSHWEGICQQYENKILKGLSQLESPWHLIRLPIIAGQSKDGLALNFSGLFTLLYELSSAPAALGENSIAAQSQVLKLKYNPDATLWFLPVDAAVHLFWRLLEDNTRPRICNLVSTQATLNREWLEYLAQAIGFRGTEVADTDAYSLPGILRRMLSDNIQVKTRNLFEVASRYQQPPIKFDKSYFQRLIEFGKLENWGRRIAPKEVYEDATTFRDLGHVYFEEFVPQKLDKRDLEEITAKGTTVGFFLEGNEPVSWLLKYADGEILLSPLEPQENDAPVRFHFSGSTMSRLIKGQLSLHKALLLREVKVEGSFLDTLRVGNAIGRFLKNHPFTGSNLQVQASKKQTQAF